METLKVVVLIALFQTMTSCPYHSDHAGPKTDRIRDLPGLNFPIAFRQYSGYLDGSKHDKLFYWFVEAEENPGTAPIIFWFNGGPGCSSLDGLLSEHGPFLITDDGATVKRNPYSWNKFANVVYLESPTKVGFSYTTSEDKLRLNDAKTARMNYNALEDFFRKFPSLRNNDLYISGESYGGVYVPTLAEVIFDEGRLNLKGFLVGNGFHHDHYFFNGRYYYMHHQGLISTEIWNNVLNQCCSNGTELTEVECSSIEWPDTGACWTAKDEAWETVHGINEYNIEAECYQRESPQEKRFRRSERNSDAKPWLHGYRCLNNTAVTAYFNTPSVQEALHVENAPVKWDICSDEVHNLYTWHKGTLKDVYWKLLSTNKLKALIYHGVLDLLCTHLSGEWFADSLDFEVLDSWEKWTYTGSFNQTQIGGFMKKYEHNLTFATVKGAGHSTPIDKPMEMFELTKRFILQSN